MEKYGKAKSRAGTGRSGTSPTSATGRARPRSICKLYDYAADGLKRALPTARIGGPHVTGPNGARTQQAPARLHRALPARHELRDRARSGSPLDFVAFHAKGAPRVVGTATCGWAISNQLRAIDNGFQIVASFPELKDMPIVIGESDPEGCAACSVATNPQNAYRNGTMYSSYTAAQIARTYELADLHKVNLLGSVTWAFEFEDQPYFDGFRDLATNGIDKPVLNVFRMLGLMGGDRVRSRAAARVPLEIVRDTGVRDRADVNALASRRSGRDLAVLVWNYHDDDLPAPGCRDRSDHRGRSSREREGRALPRGPRPEQYVRGVEEDGVAAAAVGAAAGGPRKSGRA